MKLKNEYIVPDFNLIKISITKDVLGDSKPEPTDKPIYNDPSLDDPFAP